VHPNPFSTSLGLHPQSWRYSAQLENKDSIIAARDATLKRYEAELHDYQRKLAVSSPEEAKEKLDSVRAELQIRAPRSAREAGES
jgi:hypothetical protein